jgi:tRNA(Arg) A34 adenosine deaminase TadA
MTDIQPQFMEAAFEAARQSAINGDYGIGSVVVKDGQILAIGYETLKSANDPVNGHAEIDAIRKACTILNSGYLEGCTLYSTHEPCPMCATASVWAKVNTIVFSVSREDMIAEMDRRSNGKFSWRQIAIPCQYILDHGSPTVELIPSYMREEGMKLFDLTGLAVK